MAGRGNFFISSPRVLLWCGAAFIMLSVAVCSERQCYWCGPLAEQIHRSRRAPPCDVPTAHVTTCEPGFMHCAIVATAPPHVESRFCVKLYQDECYPLFCNSTRTWKMTCPCRGNLCNGNNTERETDAFAVLSKLVTTTQNVRVKKRDADANFISSNQERTKIITNITNQLDQTDEEPISHSKGIIVVTATEREELTDTKDVSTTIAIDDNVSPSSNSVSTISSVNPVIVDHTEETPKEDNTINDLTTPIPNVNSHIDLNETNNSDKSNDVLVIKTTEATAARPEKMQKAATTIATETTVDTEINKEAAINKLVDTKDLTVTPSEKLPNAEALQQNSSPSPLTDSHTKFTESININVTEANLIESNTTVQPTKAGADCLKFAYILPIVYLPLLISY